MLHDSGVVTIDGEVKKLIKAITIILILLIPQVQAAVNGQDLLLACEASINSETGGIKAQVCEYYVTPCACDLGENHPVPRVCLPDGLAEDDLAKIVIEGLKKSPALLHESAGTAAALILARIYPCKGKQ